MAGLKIYDEAGKVIFDERHRLFKVLGETTVNGSGHFQIPVNGNQKAAILPIQGRGNLLNVRALGVDQETGIVTYTVTSPITFVYGCW